MKQMDVSSPAVFSIFHSATMEAERINRLTTGFMIAAGFIFLLVVFLLFYVCVRFRAKRSKNPASFRRNRKAEAAIIGLPLLLVGFFFYRTLQTMHATEPSLRGQQPDIVITGHQWWWEARYPGTGVTTANEIHLPAGQDVLLQLESADVIHDWWVPAFGPKMDMVPGIANHLRIHIKKPGVYEGTCSEFCGAQHAWMRIRVIAQDPVSYGKWLDAMMRPSSPPTDSIAITGEALFLSATCADCHTIRGTSAKGSAGPDLTHVASRETLLAGKIGNTEANLEKWLSHPQEIKPGAYMPDFLFPRDSLKALIVYLHTLL